MDKKEMLLARSMLCNIFFKWHYTLVPRHPPSGSG